MMTDDFPNGWAFGQGTDPYGLPYLTVPSTGMYSTTMYHEGFHIFQYNSNSPGFGYSGDTQWYTESSAQWYKAEYAPDDIMTYVQAGAIVGNPQLALLQRICYSHWTNGAQNGVISIGQWGVFNHEKGAI